MEEQWAQLAEAFNDVEAEIICGLLQSANIPCRKVDRDALAGAMRVIGGQAYEIRILVPRRLLQQARELLRSAKEA
ncbi:MAG TPA: DUF2007 domain-containing protein, partial [Bacillota bacterium]|nr:DUF2007 domain-containing protein [Bacillota bacterium]